MALRDHMHTLKCFGADGWWPSSPSRASLKSKHSRSTCKFKMVQLRFVAAGNNLHVLKAWTTVDMELLFYHQPFQAVPRNAAAEGEDPSRDSPVAGWNTWIAPGQSRLSLCDRCIWLWGHVIPWDYTQNHVPSCYIAQSMQYVCGGPTVSCLILRCRIVYLVEHVAESQAVKRPKSHPAIQEDWYWKCCCRCTLSNFMLTVTSCYTTRTGSIMPAWKRSIMPPAAFQTFGQSYVKVSHSRF